MAHIDCMGIKFRWRAQRQKFEELAEREMHPNFYADDGVMTVLGLRDSVIYLLSQIGWETTPIRRQFVTYRRLTLEFLSSLIYLPNHGKGINRGNDEPEEHEFLSGNIHNPTFRYFHKILAHTLFGKRSNITTVSRDELFIIFCASHNRPVNGATYMLASFDLLIQDDHAPIQIGGLIIMIANAIGLRQPMLDLNPFCGIQPMNILFLFNTMFIGNLGPEEFELLINNQAFYLFTMPSPMTSVHNRNNWLYNLDGIPSPVRSTPTGYHDAASAPHPIPSVESAVPDLRHHMPGTDYNTAIQALMPEQDAIREELTMMGHEFIEYMSRMTNQFHELLHRVNSFAPPTRDSTSG
ncbi:hypothetical protein KIW84_042598 [Lathyrus oleraceus]|uniref:Uncharacterized protein n=1 Tax=Pisum sativum TaxID=3888 RepID=A0A9D4XBB4_PEA|nr:hypothetical protein KIW84_042598 [Pisum sativum]